MGCTPNALIHEDISRGGLGITSLLHPYAQEQTTTIVKSFYDTGRLGYITKAALIKQLGNMGMLAGVQCMAEITLLFLAPQASIHARSWHHIERPPGNSA